MPAIAPALSGTSATDSTFTLCDFKRMMEALSMSIILHDAVDKSILWANTSACNVLGFTLEELLPLKAPDMSRNSAQYRREIGHQWLQGAVDNGINVIEWCYRTKQGDEILSEATATLVHLTHRDVIMVQFRDIAREEQTRRKMKQLETHLREFLRNSDEGVAVLQRDGTIDFISSTGQRLLGLYTGHQLPNKFTDLCTPESTAEILELLSLPLAEGVSFPVRYRIRQRNGQLRWHHASCRYIASDELTGYILHFLDITAQVEAEEARLRHQAAMEYLARHNAMGEMATAIAHELIQPLAAIQNFLEGTRLRLNQDSYSRDDIAWGIEHAARQVNHAATIIKSVREYVVKLEQTDTTLNLADIIQDVRYFIELKAAETEVRVDIAPSEEALVVSCEKVMIGQVILNLAFNAIEEMGLFSPGKRRIRIETARDGDKAILRVIDYGHGIDADHRAKIFDGFYSSKVSGNGIGLALCKNIVTRHHGDIWAQPGETCGTVFCFSLPLAGVQA